MKSHQKAFIDLALKHGALRFGEFTLKSGRVSPYFFNIGALNTGQQLAELGRLYATAIVDANLHFDMLFGPAYKGIPLVNATAIALATEHQRDVPFAFNRKEPKDHGEGGQTVGAPLQGGLLITDDVITAGTAFRESIATIQQAGATVVGMIVALDRQERGRDNRSAIEEIEQSHGIKVISIVTLADLIDYLKGTADMKDTLTAIMQYQERYGTA